VLGRIGWPALFYCLFKYSLNLMNLWKWQEASENCVNGLNLWVTCGEALVIAVFFLYQCIGQSVMFDKFFFYFNFSTVHFYLYIYNKPINALFW
jgi:hypothetical protein